MRACISRWMLGLIAVVALASTPCSAVEPRIPPAPKDYFNDSTGVVDPATAKRLDRRLADFERQTSNELLVVIDAKLPEGTFLEEYTVKCAQAWGVGSKEKDNGIVLFVFIQDRKLRIEVGYGLEGALPDGVAKLIIENEIKPAFKAGNYAAGVERGIDAIIKATKHEYKAVSKAPSLRMDTNPAFLIIGFFFAIVLIRFLWFALWNGDVVFANRGQTWIWNFLDLLMLFGSHLNRSRSSGGSWSSGISWSGGGSSGGFSGGGGSFGGGGASGDW